MSAIAWYEEQRAGLGIELLAEFEDRLELAKREIGTGVLVASLSKGVEIRRFRLRRFGRYSVLLMVAEDALTVVAFAHASRRPSYWHDRLR